MVWPSSVSKKLVQLEHSPLVQGGKSNREATLRRTVQYQSAELVVCSAICMYSSTMRRIFSAVVACLFLFCGGDSDRPSPFASGTRRTSLFVDAFVVTAPCNTRVPAYRIRSLVTRARPWRSEEERDAVYEERKEQIKKALCLNQKQIDKLVSTTPIVLQHRIENAIPKIEMLQERLGIDQKTAGKIISHPFVFTRSCASLMETIDWLQDRLNLDAKSIARICSSSPYLLGKTVESLEEKIKLIRNCLDLTDAEVTKLLSKYSSLFSINVEEKIPAKMSYLRERFQLDDDKSVKEILKKSPRLVTMSIETSIEPKLAFYSALIGEKRAKRLVMESTSLLKVSLEKKLKPRLAEVQKLGMKVNWDETLIQRLARRSEERWERYKLEDVKVVRQREREKNLK